MQSANEDEVRKAGAEELDKLVDAGNRVTVAINKTAGKQAAVQFEKGFNAAMSLVPPFTQAGRGETKKQKFVPGKGQQRFVPKAKA